jgi:hypothetical protein
MCQELLVHGWGIERETVDGDTYDDIYIYILILLHPGLIDPVSGLGNPLGRITFPYHKERIGLTMLLA